MGLVARNGPRKQGLGASLAYGVYKWGIRQLPPTVELPGNASLPIAEHRRRHSANKDLGILS